MPDQIYDKKTVGIPADVVTTRAEVEAMRNETKANVIASAENASVAQGYAKTSQEFAKESERWALVRSLGLRMAPDPPEDLVNGAVWFKTNDEESKITALLRYDAESTRRTLYPDESRFPSPNLYPFTIGEWHEFKLAPETFF